MVASKFPPKETSREESVDPTSAERELDLGRSLKCIVRARRNLSREPRARMFLALSFLLQLELNSLSGKLELRRMSPWSTSTDTF